MRKDFIAPAVQQINIPVQLGLTETHQDWLRNCSARCVTLGCTAKEQVECIQSYDYINYFLYASISDKGRWLPYEGNKNLD